jgi:hypothetical protein
MDNSDMNVVGEHLGYDWNQVCDEVSKAGFYAEDGDGAFTVNRSSKSEYSSKSKIINEIFVAIFANYPNVKTIQITNN